MRLQRLSNSLRNFLSFIPKASRVAFYSPAPEVGQLSDLGISLVPYRGSGANEADE